MTGGGSRFVYGPSGNRKDHTLSTKKDSLGRRNAGWTKPGPGRPQSIERDSRGGKRGINAQLDFSDYAALSRIAKRENKSKAELIRTYITWGIENDKRPV
jgi:hypothetical protein